MKYIFDEFIEKNKNRIIVGILGVICVYSLDSGYLLNFAESTGDVYYRLIFPIVMQDFYSTYVVPTVVGGIFSLSYYIEWKTGIYQTIISKMSIKRYCWIKTGYVFVSAMIIVIIGLWVYAFCVHLKLPWIEMEYLQIYSEFPFAELLKTNIWGYFWIVIGFQGIWCGMWAVVSLCVSAISVNPYVTAIFPMVVTFVLGQLDNILNIPHEYRVDEWFCTQSLCKNEIYTFTTCFVLVGCVVLISEIVFQKTVRWRLSNE